MKKFLLSLAALMAIGVSSAQQLIFGKFERMALDMEAKINPRIDNNGAPCALVRVCVVLEDPQIQGNLGNIGEMVHKRESEYGVYLPVDTRRIRINHKEILPFVYEFECKLEKYATYELYLLRQKETPAIVDSIPQNSVAAVDSDTYRDELKYLEEAPYLATEVMPLFQGGGLSDFSNWVHNNMQYPKLAAENRISGRVIASFVVEADGSIKQVDILQSPDRILADEVVRIIKSSPLWNPGKHNEKPVRVKQTISVTFSLINDAGGSKNRRYKVGDYYKKGQLEGVVFQVDSTGRHGKIVSLQESKCKWGLYDLFSGMLSVDDGSLNSLRFGEIYLRPRLSTGDATINTSRKDAFPIFSWCSSLGGSGWYIPAIEELQAIQKVKSEINATIALIEKERGEKMEYLKNQYYWSSTEYDGSNAYLVLMSNGWAGSYFGKNNLDYARAVATF